MLKVMSTLTAAVLALSFGLIAPVFAQSEVPHKLVIQVSTDDPGVQKTALNNAVNLQRILGLDQVDIEIVAYGPGLSLLTAESPESYRVPDLAQQEIIFSACANTMKNVAKKTGKEVELVEGAQVVPAGVMRILELQEQRYAYLRP